jgi:hypothetical protein
MAYTVSALLGNTTALARTCHLLRTAPALSSTAETRYVTVSVRERVCVCVCVSKWMSAFNS